MKTVSVGRPRILTRSDEVKILKLIADRRIECECDYGHTLWNRSRVEDLLLKEFSINASKHYTLRLLKTLGMAFRRQHKRVSPAWLSSGYLEIKVEEKKEKKEKNKDVKIFFIDTVHTSLDILRKHGRVNETDLRKPNKASVVYGAVPMSKGQTFFWVSPDQSKQDRTPSSSLSSTQLINFIKALMNEPEMKNKYLYLILEKYEVCRDTQFKDYIRSIKRLKVFYINDSDLM